jgi:hypothetical protein
MNSSGLQSTFGHLDAPFTIFSVNAVYSKIFLPDEDHVVAEMISTLGALPARWWDKWEKKGDFFLEDGSWKVGTHRAHAPWSRSLEERLKLMGREGEFGLDEIFHFENLLRSMLAYEPTDRISANDAIRSEWMRRWGLPAMRRNRVLQQGAPGQA